MTDLSLDRWLLVGLAVLAIALAVPLVSAHGDGASVTDDPRGDHPGAATGHHGPGGPMHGAAEGHAAGGGHHVDGASHHADGQHQAGGQYHAGGAVPNGTHAHGAVSGWNATGNVTHAHGVAANGTAVPAANNTVGNATAGGHGAWGCH